MTTTATTQPCDSIRSETSQRIAIYVAGDGNIFFPALVALNSIRQHNQHIPFDYYMLFDEADLSPRMRALLDEHEIGFIDTGKLHQYGSLEEFGLMSENIWPREVFYNWLVPHHLSSMGYSHAVKADYDLLCVQSYNLSDILLQTETFAGNTWTQDMQKDGIDPETLTTLGFAEGEAVRIPYFNVGFVAINVDLYLSRSVFDRFKWIYKTIQDQKNVVKVAEQAAIAMLCALDKHKIRHLSKDYNMRITGLPDLSADLVPKIRNVHYLTSNKPWKPLSFKYIPAYASDTRAGLYLFRNLWLNSASKVSGFEEFISERPLTDVEYVGLFSRVLSEIYTRHNTNKVS